MLYEDEEGKEDGVNEGIKYTCKLIIGILLILSMLYIII